VEEETLDMTPEEIEALKTLMQDHKQYLKDWKQDLINKGMSGAYLGADARVSLQRCRFPSDRPGRYALRPSGRKPAPLPLIKPSNPHTPASSGASIP